MAGKAWMLIGLAMLALGSPCRAQSYSPAETFAPRPMTQPVNTYRSSDGLPGPDYWQDRADYTIHASLDEKTPSLSGSEIITYTNNSPDALDILWLQLDQNIYKADSRSKHTGAGYRTTSNVTDGFVLDSVEVL